MKDELVEKLINLGAKHADELKEIIDSMDFEEIAKDAMQGDGQGLLAHRLRKMLAGYCVSVITLQDFQESTYVKHLIHRATLETACEIVRAMQRAHGLGEEGSERIDDLMRSLRKDIRENPLPKKGNQMPTDYEKMNEELKKLSLEHGLKLQRVLSIINKADTAIDAAKISLSLGTYLSVVAETAVRSLENEALQVTIDATACEVGAEITRISYARNLPKEHMQVIDDNVANMRLKLRETRHEKETK